MVTLFLRVWNRRRGLKYPFQILDVRLLHNSYFFFLACIRQTRQCVFVQPMRKPRVCMIIIDVHGTTMNAQAQSYIQQLQQNKEQIKKSEWELSQTMLKSVHKASRILLSTRFVPVLVFSKYNIFSGYFDPELSEKIFQIMKIYNFRGDLTDISAKEPLVCTYMRKQPDHETRFHNTLVLS